MPRWSPDAEGRLMKAAIALFDEQGYEQTTVAEIAAAAGLTKRTFFRYFSDKREVLFDGSHELQHRWVSGIESAAPSASAIVAVGAGLDAVTDLFADRHAYARTRARVIGANPELQERELIKLQSLVTAIGAALGARGVPPDAALLAAHTGVTVFHVAFARWVAQEDPTALPRLVRDTLTELRAVTAES